jgi:3-oxoacyl-(acyl-carrier-protein) synthase
MTTNRRVVITGMSVNTVLGDTLEDFLNSLLAGRSAIDRWKAFDTSEIDVKIGGDLSGYEIALKISGLKGRAPDDVIERIERIFPISPWSTQLSTLLAVDAFRDAALFSPMLDLTRVAAIVAGENLNLRYNSAVWDKFRAAPNTIDARYALTAWDGDLSGCIADVLGIRGSLYTVSGACASGNVGLRSAVDEIQRHDMDAVLVVGAVFDINPALLQGFANLGALSVEKFDDEPTRASRPFDVLRQGFVAAHAGAALALEEREFALRRGARIYGEVVGVEINSSGMRSAMPSEEDEARVLQSLLANTGTDPREVDFVSAHATSTQKGDIAEIRALKKVFGAHVRKLKINAPKSMLGHSLVSASTVETVAAVLQMQAGMLHPSINIAQQDAEIDLDVCAGEATPHPVRCLVKNAFGFWGINSACLIKCFDGSR